MNRDRDATGRPRNARPRDRLGRPLARDPGVEAPVDPPPLAPADALRRAQGLLDTGHAFTAHEVLEAVWKSTEGADRALWRGLAQLAVGLTHLQRDNPRGAAALLRRGAATLAPYAGTCPHGVPIDDLRAWAAAAAADPNATPPVPRICAADEPGQAADDRA